MGGEARSVSVKLSLDVADAIAASQEFGSAMQDAMGAAEQGAADAGAGLEEFGELAGKVAGATGAALGVVGKAAMDWESQFAGVEKTIDGTSEQLAGLEDELREMARTMPATHEEIAATAEAAGQLGVATADIADFTTTMIQLGETTNITADDAATSIAQFMNVMGTAADQVDEIGNTLVDLGNKGASTEGQILDMAQRVAGAGALIGASEADVLALSSAMANLGIESELGGGAVQRVLTGMNTQVMAGTETLDRYAETAGVSAERFARAWERDPVRAFDKFIQGLGRVQDEGGDVVSALDEMGIKGTQNLQVMLRLAGAGDTLTTALDQSSDAWDGGTALLDEYAKRAATTEAQVTIAWNRMKDAAIDAGEGLLPVITQVSEAVGGVADAYNLLPGPVQTTTTQMALVAGAAAGLLFLGTKVAGAIGTARTQMAGLATSSTRGAGAMRGFVAATGGLLAIQGVVAVLGGIQDATEESLPGLNRLSVDLLKLKDGQISSLGGEFDSLGDSIGRIADKNIGETIGDPLLKVLTLGQREGNRLNEATNEIAALDAALAGLVSQGSPDVAAEALAAVGESSNLSAEQMQMLLGILPSYNEALAGVEASSLLASDGSKELAGGLGTLLNPLAETQDGMQSAADAADEAARAAEEFANTVEYLEGVLSGRASWRDYEESIDAATAALKRNGRTLDIETGKGRENEAALDAIADAALGVAENLSPLRRGRFLENAREDFVAAADSMGMSERAAERLADKLGLLENVPPPKPPRIDTKPAERDINSIEDYLRDLTGTTARPRVDPETAGAMSELGQVQSALARIVSKTVTVTVRRSGILNSGGFADGGYTGDGGKYEPAGIVHRGEFVVTAEDTARDRAFLEARYGSLPGYADGGEVTDPKKRRKPTKAELIDRAYGQFNVDVDMGVAGVRSELDDLRDAIRDAKGTWTDAMVEQSKLLLRTAREYDKLSDELDQTRDAQKSYRQEVAGSFDNDIFGNGVAGLQLQLEADRNDSRAMLAAIREAEVKGLDGGLARELFASGDLTTASQIADMSRAEIRQLEQLYGSTSAAQQALGGFAANDQYGGRIDRLEDRLRRQEKRFDRRVDDFFENRLPKTLESAVAKGAREGIADRGRTGAQYARAGGR